MRASKVRSLREGCVRGVHTGIILGSVWFGVCSGDVCSGDVRVMFVLIILVLARRGVYIVWRPGHVFPQDIFFSSFFSLECPLVKPGRGFMDACLVSRPEPDKTL